jgi:hypothetical protein
VPHLPITDGVSGIRGLSRVRPETAAVRDPWTAPIPGKLKALLAIADAVQRGGHAVRSEHIERARREGAADLEIHDAVLIAAAFSMFNRYVDGLAAWTPSDLEGHQERARLVPEHACSAAPLVGARTSS